MDPYQPNNPRPKPTGKGISAKTPRSQTTSKNGSAGTEILQKTTVQPPPLPGVDERVQPWSLEPVQIQAAASALMEYIASASPRIPIQFGGVSGLPGAGSGIHTLPLYVDELERDFGTDIYLKMLIDAQIAASDSIVRYAVLDRPAVLTTGADPKHVKDPLKVIFGKRVMAFVEANLFEHMEPKLPELCYELLEGMALGYKLAEQVYEMGDLGYNEGEQTLLKAVKCKPQESVSYLVDLFNNILGYVPRAMATGMFATIFPEGNGVVPGLVPIEKMVRFTWRERNGDPRGTSYLRPAYIPWRFKIGLYPAYEAFLARFAQPSAAIDLQGAPLPPMISSDGTMTADPSMVMTGLLMALRNFQAGGAIVNPVGEVKLLETQNQGQSYLQAFQMVNGEITRALLLQELASNQSKFGTRAQSQVHQDTMGLLIAYTKQKLADCINKYVIRPLVYYNYGNAGLAVAPSISFGEIEQQDVTSMGTMVATMNQAHMLVPSQYNDIMDMIHLPQIPQEIIDMMMAAFKAGLEQAANPQPPMGQPGAPGQPGQPGQPQIGPDGNPIGGRQNALTGNSGQQPPGGGSPGAAAKSSLVPSSPTGNTQQPPVQGAVR